MAEWIDTEEAAQISGYHVNYLRTLLREEKISAKKKGGSYWIDRQSLLDYIRAAQTSADKRHGARSKSEVKTTKSSS
jgi:Helix-turn-helix domain